MTGFSIRPRLLALPLAATCLFGCLRQETVSGADDATVRASTTSTDPKLELLTKELGIADSLIYPYYDEVTKESSYVVLPSLPSEYVMSATGAEMSAAGMERKPEKEKEKLKLYRSGVGFTYSTLNSMIEKSKTTKSDGGVPLANAPAQYALAKSSQTRWRHPTSLLDVKALTEVTQIRVFIKTYGSDKLGPNWQAGVRAAIANWNAQVKGSGISYVETTVLEQSDVVVRGGLDIYGSTYLIFMNPYQYVERIGSYGGNPSYYGVDIVLNIGFENTSVAMSQKTTCAMSALGKILNIWGSDRAGWGWNGGTFEQIPGTPTWDGDAGQPGASIFTSITSNQSTPALTAGDLKTIQTVYPTHGATGKTWDNNLYMAGYESQILVATNVNEFEVAGDTLIYSTYDGKLFRRIGVNGPNVQLWPGYGSPSYLTVSEFSHSEGYLAVRIMPQTALFAKTPNGNWFNAYASGYYNFKLAGERLVLHNYDYDWFQSKYLTSAPGSWISEWPWGGDIQGFDVHPVNQRLAALINGTVYIKDGMYGSWYGLWSQYDGLLEKVRLSSDIIAAYHFDYDMWAGRTSIFTNGAWWYGPVPMYTADDISLCAQKYASLQQSTYLRIVDFATWIVYEHYTLPESQYVWKTRLGGANCDYVTTIDPWGTLSAKYGQDLSTTYFPYMQSAAYLPKN